MAILAAFLLFVTWVPAMLLLFVQILLSGSFDFARANLILFPAITLFAFLEVSSSAARCWRCRRSPPAPATSR